MGFRANRLSIGIAVAVARVYHFRFNHPAHRCLPSDLRLDRTLAVDLRHGGVRRCRLVHEHHLVRVLRHLATRPLVKVSGGLALAGSSRGICRKIHVVPHLNARLGHVNHLGHQVLVRHLQVLLLRLLVLGAYGGERAHLERVGDVFVAGAGEKCRRALLVKHLSSRLLRGRSPDTTVVLHHDLGLNLLPTHVVVKRPMVRAADHGGIVELISLVLHHAHQLLLRQPIVHLIARLL